MYTRKCIHLNENERLEVHIGRPADFLDYILMFVTKFNIQPVKEIVEIWELRAEGWINKISDEIADIDTIEEIYTILEEINQFDARKFM